MLNFKLKCLSVKLFAKKSCNIESLFVSHFEMMKCYDTGFFVVLSVNVKIQQVSDKQVFFCRIVISNIFRNAIRNVP